MKARRYEYFISYSFQELNGGGTGTGNTMLVLNRKVNERMLDDISSFIKKKERFKKVVIQNFQLTRERRAL